nr:hypothetical protein [Tanacetum cinerariifolium]
MVTYLSKSNASEGFNQIIDILNGSSLKTSQSYYCSEVILNGDLPPLTRSVDGVEKAYPNTTADEKLARKNELKATDLETLSMDYLYNNLKIYKAKVNTVKGNVSTVGSKAVTLNVLFCFLTLSYLMKVKYCLEFQERTSCTVLIEGMLLLQEYDSFLFEIEFNQGELTSVVMKANLTEPRVHVPNVLTTHPTLMLDSDFIPFDNSLPEFETFYFDIEEKNSGSTTIHADISLSDLKSFNFDFKPDPGELTSIVDSRICENILFATNMNFPPKEDHYPLFAYVVWIFISFLTYPVVPPHLFSFRNEDTIFDPGIANYHFPSLLPYVSHQCETFMKFNVYPKLLNESLMEILSYSCSPMEQ